MQRILQLEGLRGIAVLMVFLFHSLKIPLFWSGVDLFFVLSGYLITGILVRQKENIQADGYWKSFYLRRLHRIMPPYLGFLAFMAIVINAPWAKLWPWYAFSAANLASTVGGAHVPHAMVPLWSLAVEEQFYFVWPFVVLLCTRGTLLKVAIAMLLVVPVIRALCTPLVPSHLYIYMLTPFRADALACGAFIAIAGTKEWLEANRQRSLYAVSLAVLLLVGCSSFPDFRMSANSVSFNAVGYSLLLVIFGGILIQMLSLRPGLLYTFMTSPPLRYMGKISFTFYLYQVPVLDLIGERVHSRPLTLGLGFLVTLALSELSWRFYEGPILSRRVERLTLAKAEVAPVYIK